MTKVTQSFNGCLPSVFSSLLLLCLNDLDYMKKGPQKGWANLCLLASVFVTVFLAGFSLTSWVLSSLLPEAYLWVSLVLASCCAVLVLAVLVNELRSQIWDSLKLRFCG